MANFTVNVDVTGVTGPLYQNARLSQLPLTQAQVQALLHPSELDGAGLLLLVEREGMFIELRAERSKMKKKGLFELHALEGGRCQYRIAAQFKVPVQPHQLAEIETRGRQIAVAALVWVDGSGAYLQEVDAQLAHLPYKATVVSASG